MRVAIAGADDARWAGAIRRLKTDVYFTPEYHAVQEASGDGAAVALVAEDAGDILFHPFMLRRIESVGQVAVPSEVYDIETVNGYTGPLASSSDPAFLRRAWEGFRSWCSDTGVVAEFIRFHPLLKNAPFADPHATVERDRDVVVIDLGPGLWERYPSAQRSRVRRAAAEGLSAGRATDEEWAAFPSLYADSMQALHARPAVLYEASYFSSLRRCVSGGVELFVVRDESDIVAAATFLVGPAYVHYHLVARNRDHSSTSATNLLLHAAAEWGASTGRTHLHLGGGRTRRANDELLRFKRTLSSRLEPYVLGRQIRDAQRLDELIRLWRSQSGSQEIPTHTFPYRVDPVTGALP